jgi:predicted O-methyltransferase YrrM
MSRLRSLLKQFSFQAHKVALRAGVFLIPVHYYASVSSIRDLERTRQRWAKKSLLPGVATTLEDQVAALKRICVPFQREYAGNEAYRHATEHEFGPGYGYIEAQALWAVVRYFRPKRIIEIGSGVSTYCMLKALENNIYEPTNSALITCIEPYPSSSLRRLGNVDLIQADVQSVALERFLDLSAGDLLFIDSSHTVRPGSDVNYLILEVLPRLAAGVIVHFHDIYLPYDYQRDVLQTYFQWMETSLLRAYLIHNHKTRILFCLSQLHYDRPRDLKEVFPSYVPARDDDGMAANVQSTGEVGHFPASIYIEML